MVLEGLRLGKQVQVVIVASEIDLTLLLDFTLKLFDNLLLLVAAVGQL